MKNSQLIISGTCTCTCTTYYMASTFIMSNLGTYVVIYMNTFCHFFKHGMCERLKNHCHESVPQNMLIRNAYNTLLVSGAPPITAFHKSSFVGFEEYDVFAHKNSLICASHAPWGRPPFGIIYT